MTEKLNSSIHLYYSLKIPTSKTNNCISKSPRHSQESSCCWTGWWRVSSRLHPVCWLVCSSKTWLTKMLSGETTFVYEYSAASWGHLGHLHFEKSVHSTNLIRAFMLVVPGVLVIGPAVLLTVAPHANLHLLFLVPAIAHIDLIATPCIHGLRTCRYKIKENWI